MPAAKVCSKPGCPTLTAGGCCPDHAREADRARGTRQQRGYGPDHFARRRRWAPRVATGLVRCSRCGERITKGQPWALDHADDRASYRGPSHATCNNSAGGRAAHE